MQRNVIIAIIAIAIVAVAGIAAFMLLKSEDSSPGIRTDLKVGDYIEYENKNNITSTTYTERYEIKSIFGDSYTVSHKDRSSTKTETMGKDDFLGNILWTSSDASDYGAKKSGTETIDTPWGQVKCTKYTVSVLGIDMTVYVGSNGVVYKEGGAFTMTLTDTSLL
ncbi:MAG: hypothetical protein IJ856_02605 [Candidatus Methanomethylophilaceae archaeon]|nr:hypothetical protein [Candidatus Methanomethylophilaceae archaeon]